MRFSEEQLNAINQIDGYVLVIACPGAGKTTVIVNRAVEMVKRGIDPKSMLTITFTKAAADEMGKRFSSLCDAEAGFSTIHAFCYRILAKRYGYTPEMIYKQSEAWSFISELLYEEHIMPNQIEEYAKEILNGISYVKNREISKEEFCPETVEKALFLKAFNAYEYNKSQSRRIDFDDMVIFFRNELRHDPEFLMDMQEQYKYITIDEFQDVNKIQADIFYMMSEKHRNLYVVGDDDQSIYQFRAAEPEIMLNFPKRFAPFCKVVYLSTNYRSDRRIIQCAASLIANNKNRFPKKFQISSKEDGVVAVKQYDGSMAQSKGIISEIKRLHNEEGLSYDDTAILFRANMLALPLTMQLINAEIPFYMTEHVSSVYESTLFYDVQAYYRLSHGKERNGDLQRILNHPARYLKSAAFKNCSYKREEMMQCCAGLKAFAKVKVADMIFDISELGKMNPERFMNYLEKVMKYRTWLKSRAEYLGKDPEEYYGVFDSLKEESKMFPTMEEWLEYADFYVRKLREVAKKNNQTGVCLSTFHSAKGLEWNTVFIVNANDGVCPSSQAVTEREFAEERRMFYVAATRAKKRLNISYIQEVKASADPHKKKKIGKESEYLYEMGLLKGLKE